MQDECRSLKDAECMHAVQEAKFFEKPMVQNFESRSELEA